jgi:hypothetical protein
MSNEQKVVVFLTLVVVGGLCVAPPGLEIVVTREGVTRQVSCKPDLLWDDRPPGVTIDAGQLLGRVCLALAAGALVVVLLPPPRVRAAHVTPPSPS